jgi:hypothetical protein
MYPWKWTSEPAKQLSKITYKTFHERDSSVNIKHSNSQLRTYTGETIPILGAVALAVKYKKKKYDLTAEVVHGNNLCLQGRDCLNKIRFQWEEIFQVETN